jgi:hypothetical protein
LQIESPTVVARGRRAIQYSEASVMESKSRGALDTPLEPVVGLAEGETRWRGMTTVCEARLVGRSSKRHYD